MDVVIAEQVEQAMLGGRTRLETEAAELRSPATKPRSLTAPLTLGGGDGDAVALLEHLGAARGSGEVRMSMTVGSLKRAGGLAV